MSNPVKSFMTILGWSLIATLKSETPDVYDLEAALMYQLVPQQNGQTSLQMVPLSMATKNDPNKGMDIILQKAHVIVVHDVNNEIEKLYLTQVSAIQLAPAGSIAQLDASRKKP